MQLRPVPRPRNEHQLLRTEPDSIRKRSSPWEPCSRSQPLHRSSRLLNLHSEPSTVLRMQLRPVHRPRNEHQLLRTEPDSIRKRSSPWEPCSRSQPLHRSSRLLNLHSEPSTVLRMQLRPVPRPRD